MRHEDVHGGSGTAAATLRDLGYEQMNGATGGRGDPELKPKRKYSRKTMKVAVPSATAGGVSAGGVSAGCVSGSGASGGTEVGCGASGGAKKRGRKPKEDVHIADAVKDTSDTTGSVGEPKEERKRRL